MSSTTGTSEQILSLPKGGGAVQGLGATFETDLNTGTGNYSIPITVPAGPNGIQPRLAIRYHSAAGNGPFGLGWTLGAMTVARQCEGRIPYYGADDDRFVIVGVEELVPLGAGRYRPKVDSMHWRVERQGAGWELTDTLGTRHQLGQNTQSRVETIEQGLTKTAMWLLEEMRDTNGNTVRYSYRQEGAQRYLEQVEWGTYALRFFYEERPDRLTSGRFGYLLETTLRASRVELHVTTLDPSLARMWRFEYEQAAGSAASLLHSVIHSGHGADGSVVEAPVLTLGYTEFRPPTLERFSSSMPGIMPGPLDSGRLELLDWDGDGLPDLIELGSGRARVWPNLGRGRWGTPRTLSHLPAPVALNEPGVAFADMEGNGTADLIMLDRSLAAYYPHRPGGGFDPPVYWSRAPTARLADRNARLVDLNGDGITDLLVTRDHFFELYFRNRLNGWESRPQSIPRPRVPPVSLHDSRVRLADMNGDGLQDLVRVDGAAVTYWPYLGNGRWAEGVRMANSPSLPRAFDPRRLYFTDIDGDGCADLVYVDFDRVLYWLNQGGVRLSDAREISFTPPARTDRIRLGDMKGNGTAGVLWSSTPTGSHAAGNLYLDFSGGDKPYLLTRIDNGLGLETHIRYRPSTEFALDDAEEGIPWRTFHPFPVQCVAEIELRDQVTRDSSVTRHRYHEGRYDSHTRTFLGFGVVDVEAIGDNSIATLRTRNVYHLGLDPEDPERSLTAEERQRLGALRRRLLRTEVYGLDGSPQQERPYQVVHHEYDVRVESAVDGISVLVPFETRTLEEQWEREAAPFAFREITYLDIDVHGNVLQQRIRVWRSGVAVPDQDLTTEASFAIDLPSNIVSLPARVTQRDAAGSVVALTVTHYDGLPHEGLPEGQVTTGNITRRDALAFPDSLATDVYGTTQPDWPALGYRRRAGEDGWWVTQTSYERREDPAGLSLIVRGMRGFDTRMEFDASRQYPQRLTDAAGNVLEGVADRRIFQMASLTDANGQETVDHFDPLGRVIGAIKPGDTDALPSSIFSYRTNILPVAIGTFHREQHGERETLDKYEYFNGGGQFIQRLVEGEGDAGRRYVMQEAREYSRRGQIKSRYLPYYVDSPEYAAPAPERPKLQMRYDALGRLTEQLKASGARVTQSFRAGSVEALDEADNLAASSTPLVHRLDGLKRVVAVEHHLADRTIEAHFHYDSVSRFLRIQHPTGGKSRMTYDLLGRIVVEDTPDTGRTLFVVDAAGNQVKRTTATGKTVHNTFDQLDRLVEVREDGAAVPEIIYRYLDADDPVPSDGLQNRRARAWRIQDRLGMVTYAYDDLGRVSRSSRRVASLPGQDLITDILYDALGRQTRITLPAVTPGGGRRVVNYRYNPRGLPESSPNFVRTAEYDVQGHLRRLVYQNNVENLVDFESATGRPERLRVLAPDGNVLRDQTYTFDPIGNLRRINSPILIEAGQFLYDDLNRLTDATYGSGEHFAYTYNDSGNITSIEGLGALTYSGPLGSGAVTGAGGLTYSYDADGHLRTAPYGTMHFDALDNLVRLDLPDGRQMECVYDFQGRRAIKRVTGGDEIILPDPNVEFRNGQATIWITFGNKRILALTNGNGIFLHADWQGTPTLYTGLDGSQIRRLAFGPYGTLRFDSAEGAGLIEGVRFTGQLQDVESGLICLGRRFYDPRLGRFMSADRAVPGVYLLESWNRYVYGHNNPLRYSDPTGRFSIGDFFAALGIGLIVAALVVAGFFTGGATWAVAGVMINVSGLLFGAAVGVAAGAVLGGISAGVSGGDIGAGILFGGFIGGVAAFAGGTLGALAAGLVGKAILSQLGIYLAGGVGGAVQGAFIGGGTGAAIGFAGGKGTVESVWSHIWKGAAIGAITGAALGLASAYLTATPNPTLRIGTIEKINPQVPATGGISEQISYVETSAGIGQSTARLATGIGGAGPVGTFIGVGSGPGPALLNIPLPIGWVPAALGQYGGMAFSTNLLIGLDKFTIFDFDKLLIFALELTPFFVGMFFTFADDGKWGWFEDMKGSLHDTLSLPEPG